MSTLFIFSNIGHIGYGFPFTVQWQSITKTYNHSGLDPLYILFYIQPPIASRVIVDSIVRGLEGVAMAGSHIPNRRSTFFGSIPSFWP